jgi:hypothetical protein
VRLPALEHFQEKWNPVLRPKVRAKKARAFSGEVDTGSPQKMRPSKEIERFHDSTQRESALEQIHVSMKHEFALAGKS